MGATMGQNQSINHMGARINQASTQTPIQFKGGASLIDRVTGGRYSYTHHTHITGWFYDFLKKIGGRGYESYRYSKSFFGSMPLQSYWERPLPKAWML